jgi:hypothetical protein
MAPEAGIEPATIRLTVECSTAELLGKMFAALKEACLSTISIKERHPITSQNRFILISGRVVNDGWCPQSGGHADQQVRRIMIAAFEHQALRPDRSIHGRRATTL